MLRSTLAALALTVTAATASHAQHELNDSTRWVPVSHDKDGATTFSFDAKTYSHDGPIVTVWVRLDYARVHENGAKYELYENVFDCAKRTNAYGAWAAYHADGSVVGSGTHNKAPTAIVPGSVGEDLLESACSGIVP